GTSAPEAAVSVMSSLAGQPDIAIGNVIGSNIANILLILGLASLVAPLIVDQQIVRLDVPVMIALSVILYLFCLNGNLGRLEGSLLIAGSIAYSVFLVITSRKETNLKVQEEYEQEYGEAKSPRRHWSIDAGLILLGLVMLVGGSRFLIDAAVGLAERFGISELVIGLTIVAVGTSLPEIATSMIASFRGEADIAVGNVVGSNIFNILLVLGLAGVMAPGGVPIAASALRFDFPVMIAVAICCLPVFFTGYRVARWEGAVFLAYYIAYMAYIVLEASDRAALFGRAMAWFVIPLTLVTLGVVTVRAIREKQGAAGG
ncbi:MAG: calcium/sodium antiporter, partial [Acidobacteria bacterium]|nr:calcium/sodium antiporter [Acidobacteriota bacterium]